MIITIAVNALLYQQNHHDYQEHAHEPGQSGYDVRKLHVAGIGDFLTDLDREGKYHHKCEDVDEGSDEMHLPFGQFLE